MASEIKVDTVSEKTSGSGVTIDGLLIKDGGISGDVSLIGTTPTFTIGDAGAEDAALVFDGNAQDFYIALDDSADDLLIGLGSTVGTTPAVSIDENLQVKIVATTASTSATTGSFIAAGGAGVAADLHVGDDVTLISDSAVLGFGADKDTTLTHTDGTGLTLNSTNKLCFNDATQYIQGASGTVLDIAATDEIELTATEVEINVTTLDVNGATDLSGALTIGGVTSFPDGSAGAPSITNTGDTNTGIYFSAADAISFSTGGTERMHIEDDGKVSIGETGAALGTLHVKTSNNAASAHADADDLVLEANGNCGISILSDNNDYGTIHFGDQDNNDIGMIRYNHGNNSMDFTINAAERMRISSGGYLQIGTTSGSAQLDVEASEAIVGCLVTCTSASYDANIINLVASRDTTNETYNILRGQNGAGFAVAIRDSGNVENVNNSYGASSDERIKQNITDASSQWDDIKALKIRNYKLKKDTSKTLIGVVAQELEASGMNGLVGGSTAEDGETVALSSDFGTVYTADDAETKDGVDAVLYTAEDQEVIDGDYNVGDIKVAATHSKKIGDIKTTNQKVKSVKYSILYMKAIKALQEAQTRIETLESKVTALEG